MQALSRDPKERQKTARELALQLEKCAGIASPTEVGEWVEAIVGPTLSAREEQIAAIESSSAGLRSPQTDSGRPIPETPDDSSSDISGVPSSHSGPYGMVGPSSGQLHHHPSSGRYPLGPATPTAPLYPPGATPAYAEQGPTTGTGSGTNMTGSLSLPVDRKLPVLGIMAGLLVLLVVMGVVVFGRLDQDKTAAPATSASGVASASPASSASSMPAITGTTSATSEPPAPSLATAEPTTTASAQPTASPTAPPATQHPTTRPTTTQAPTSRPTATQTANATATQTTKPPPKNCDPPWTIDEKGHRQYKRECL